MDKRWLLFLSLIAIYPLLDMCACKENKLTSVLKSHGHLIHNCISYGPFALLIGMPKDLTCMDKRSLLSLSPLAILSILCWIYIDTKNDFCFWVLRPSITPFDRHAKKLGVPTEAVVFDLSGPDIFDELSHIKIVAIAKFTLNTSIVFSKNLLCYYNGPKYWSKWYVRYLI